MILEHPLVSRTLATGSPAPRWQPRFWDADAAYEQRREAILFSREQKDPCEGCWRQQVCQEGCELWRSRYLQRQKGIVAYGEKLRRDRPPQRQDVFAYSHPDLVRRYEKTHPCAGCLLEKGCQDPCARYLHWYDLRMALARHRAGQTGRAPQTAH